MTETPCPTYPWCEVDGDHVFHFAHVGDLLDDITVMVFAIDGPAEVAVTAYGPGTTRTAGIPQTVLPPAAARTLGQVLVARGRDRELGEALIRAADLIGGE